MTSTKARKDPQIFIDWFRHSAPYIHAHRGRTFVITFGGEAVADEESFRSLISDIALLHSLGVRLVLVHGARPQIAEQLAQRGEEARVEKGIPVTNKAALLSVKEAVGMVRVEIESLLSTGVANSPMEGARLHVDSGTFVTAMPVGVRDGIDYESTGEVRRIDVDAIRARLDAGAIILLSPLGYSVTGETFRIAPDEVARATAVALKADKLVCLVEGKGVVDASRRTVHQLTPSDAETLARKKKRWLPEDVRVHLRAAASACANGVRRAHLVSRTTAGALLLELFTRDGIGTMVTSETYEGTRPATLADVGGIVSLIRPLEDAGVLVRRPRKQLEMDIEKFTVVERDGMTIACAALYRLAGERIAELACVAVHPEYRRTGRGDALLDFMEQRATTLGIDRIFVLTTHASHWFVERGFEKATVDDLPGPKRQLYNQKRNSKVLIKTL
jgi:amino-acid N-acetyltransferase